MYKIGIDLGGTNIAVGVVDENISIIGRGKRKTNSPRSAEEIFKDMADATKDAIADANITIDEVASIGIGIPGSINKKTGYIEYSNNLYLEMIPAIEIFSQYFPGIPIFIENDANCAGLGEAYAGAGKGYKDVVAVTLGTGVGSGVVVDGKLVTGCGDSACEFGHVVIDYNYEGKPCTCGRKGCWESFASATALIEQTKAKMLECKDSKMWELVDGDINNTGARTAFDAKRLGDPSGTEVVDHYIYLVSIGVANIINALQPDILCIGGGISNEKDNLIIPLREYSYKQIFNKNYERTTKICTAELTNDAGIIGAALLNR